MEQEKKKDRVLKHVVGPSADKKQEWMREERI